MALIVLPKGIALGGSVIVNLKKKPHSHVAGDAHMNFHDMSASTVSASLPMSPCMPMALACICLRILCVKVINYVAYSLHMHSRKLSGVSRHI